MVIMFDGHKVVNSLPDAIYSVVFDENDHPSVVRNELTTVDIVPFSNYGVVRYGFLVKHKNGKSAWDGEDFVWDKELLCRGLFTSEDAAQCWIKENCKDYLFGKGDVIYAIWRYRVIELTYDHLRASDDLVYCFKSKDVGGEFIVYKDGTNVWVCGEYESTSLLRKVYMSKEKAEEHCKIIRIRKDYNDERFVSEDIKKEN